jgi:hypothetical protein
VASETCSTSGASVEAAADDAVEAAADVVPGATAGDVCDVDVAGAPEQPPSTSTTATQRRLVNRRLTLRA